jgi:hypothetical protein
MPLMLTDAQMDLLTQLSLPIDVDRRPAFLQAVSLEPKMPLASARARCTTLAPGCNASSGNRPRYRQTRLRLNITG